MKAYRIIFLLMVLLNSNSRLSAQLASDVFSFFGDQIISNAMYFSRETVLVSSGYIPSGVPIYQYGEERKTQCKIAYIGTDYNTDSPVIDGVRIYGGGNDLLLEQWAYSPIFNVSYITLNKNNKQRCISVDLDRKTTALIFGGPIYETGNEAPEMMIVLVKGNEAKLIFDRPAMVYAYTPEPNFSIEYVEKMDWENYGDTGDYTPNAKTIASQTKHKIWKEGNMLKYKSWK